MCCVCFTHHSLPPSLLALRTALFAVIVAVVIGAYQHVPLSDDKRRERERDREIAFVSSTGRERRERERERGAAAAAKVTLQIYAHMREIYLCDACAALFTIRN